TAGSGATGTLTGVVQDTAAVPLFGVTVRAALGGDEASATTDAQGRFSFDGLSPGVWVLAFEKSGFKSLRVDNVLVAAGANSIGPYTLELGTSTPIDLDGGLLLPDAGPP